MATRFNKLGPVYPLGKFTVAVVGTPVDLNTNVGATGLQDNAGSGTSLKCALMKVSTPSTNTGNIFLVRKGQTAAGNAGLDVVLVVQPNNERELGSPQNSNPFTPDQYSLDTDVAGQVAWVTLLIS